MTMNGAVLPGARAATSSRAKSRAYRRRSSPARSRTTSSKSSWCGTPTSIRPNLRCASSRTSSRYTSKHMPKFNSISISGYHMQEAGATADLELGYTLADGIEYAARRRRGRARHRRVRTAPVVLLGDRHELLHGDRQDARRAPAVGEARAQGVQCQRAQSLSLRTHCQTSGWSLTAQDLFNNVTRTCVEAMAATQGHTQSLHTNALDEAHRAADRLLRPHRPQHAALPAAGDRHLPRHRSVGRQLLRRAADLRARSQRALGPHRGGRSARRHGEGDRRRHAEDAHRRSCGAHAGAHRLRASRRSSASTSIASTTRTTIDILKVDNNEVRERRSRKLQRLRGERDEKATRRRRSTALTEGRARRAATCSSSPSTRPAPRRSVGEISDATREGLRPPPRRDPRHLRRLPVGGRQHEQATSRRCAARRRVRQERRAPPAHPHRQDGPGRSRPRRRR